MTLNLTIDPALPGQDRDSLYRMSEALRLSFERTGLTLHGSRVLHGIVHHVRGGRGISDQLISSGLLMKDRREDGKTEALYS
jgi:hypothetical protein